MLPLLLLVGLGSLAAQRILPTLSPIPSDCCFPMIWQAELGDLGSRDEFGKFVFNQFTQTGSTFYDAYRKMRVFKLRDTETGASQTTWDDFKMMKRYRLTETDGCHECRISNLTRPFPRCLPDNITTYEGTHTMGYGSSSTTIQSWRIMSNNTEFKVLTSKESDGSCYPLTNMFFQEGDVNYAASRWFTRFKTAILLPNVFTVSKVCKTLEKIESGSTYYDGFRQLRVTKLRDSATGSKLTTWQNYQKMKEYRLTETSGCYECLIRNLTRPFPRCLPANITTYEGTHTMGYGSSTTTIQSWTILRNSTIFKLLTSRESDGTCYPLTNTLFLEGATAGTRGCTAEKEMYRPK